MLDKANIKKRANLFDSQFFLLKDYLLFINLHAIFISTNINKKSIGVNLLILKYY